MPLKKRTFIVWILLLFFVIAFGIYFELHSNDNKQKLYQTPLELVSSSGTFTIYQDPKDLDSFAVFKNNKVIFSSLVEEE